MDIYSQLASRKDGKKAGVNKKAAAMVLENPLFLEDLANGLMDSDGNLAGDCADVITEVALKRADLVAPYAERLAVSINHKKTRVRWEVLHSLALCASDAWGVIAVRLDDLNEIIQAEKSIIVRDYAVDVVGNFAGINERTARSAYPILVKALNFWDGRHARQALNGLMGVVSHLPELGGEIYPMVQPFLQANKGVVRKAAKQLIRLIENPA